MFKFQIIMAYSFPVCLYVFLCIYAWRRFPVNPYEYLASLLAGVIPAVSVIVFFRIQGILTHEAIPPTFVVMIGLMHIGTYWAWTVKRRSGISPAQIPWRQMVAGWLMVIGISSGSVLILFLALTIAKVRLGFVDEGPALFCVLGVMSMLVLPAIKTEAKLRNGRNRNE